MSTGLLGTKILGLPKTLILIPKCELKPDAFGCVFLTSQMRVLELITQPVKGK